MGNSFKPGGQRLIRLREVLAKTGRSRSAVYADPTFPRVIKLSARASAWLEVEIDAWIAERVAESRGLTVAHRRTGGADGAKSTKSEAVVTEQGAVVTPDDRDAEGRRRLRGREAGQ
jgi:prophage regulatory protein